MNNEEIRMRVIEILVPAASRVALGTPDIMLSTADKLCRFIRGEYVLPGAEEPKKRKYTKKSTEANPSTGPSS